MRRHRGTVAVMATLWALAPVAESIGGVEGSRQTSSYTLSQQKPGKSTSEHFVFDYVNPDDPDAKPPAVRRVITVLPLKAHYDTAAPARCTASDAELMADGASACPAGSALGGGTITADTGFDGPARIIESDVEFFNNADEFIYLITTRGSGARLVIRADVTRRKTITEADMLPGAPPDGTAVDQVDVKVGPFSTVRDGVRRNYITTPAHCPRRGYWVTAVRFVYADGVGQTVKNRVRCDRGGAS
jgi:hypothetical protein